LVLGWDISFYNGTNNVQLLQPHPNEEPGGANPANAPLENFNNLDFSNK